MPAKRNFVSKLWNSKPDSPLWMIAGLLWLLALLAWIFGYEHPPMSPTLLLAVLVAAMLVGGLGGFLFGLPTLEYSAGAAKPNATGKTGDAQAPTASTATKTSTGGYRPSTNLDEVANWLTKIIIGATLVEIKDIGQAIKDISGFIVAPCTPGCGVFAQPFVASIIVAAFIAGFLFGYLWTRLHYAGIAATADRRVITIVNKETGEVTEVATEVAPKVATDTELTPKSLATRPTVNVNNRWVTDPGSSDPNKGQFGGMAIANGRALSAQFATSNLDGFTQVILSVRSTDEENNPLSGTVVFHLHPTFKIPVVDVQVSGGVAELSFLAWGAFTVGAVADGGATRLELDLAQQAAAPEEFRNR